MVVSRQGTVDSYHISNLLGHGVRNVLMLPCRNGSNEFGWLPHRFQQKQKVSKYSTYKPLPVNTMHISTKSRGWAQMGVWSRKS